MTHFSDSLPIDQNKLPDYLPEPILNYLYNNSRDGFAACSLKGEILECNQMLADFLMYSKDELIGKTVADFTDPVFYKSEVKKYLEEQLFVRGYSERYEKELIARDGSHVPVEINLFAVRNESQDIVGWWAIVRDIRDRKLNIEKLKASESLLKLTQEIALVGGWEYDCQKMQLVWTGQTYKIHEVDRDFQPSIEKSLSFYDAESADYARSIIEKSIRNGGVADFQLQMTTAKGRKKWVEVMVRSERDQDGNILKIYGTLQDVSKEKAYEQKLRVSREQYRSLQENLPIGIFRTTAEGKFISVNEELVRIAGAKDKADLYSRNVQDFYFDEAERQKLIEKIQKEGSVKNHLILVKRVDGSVFRGAVSSRLITDHQNKLSYFDSMLRDVTAQYEAEMAIRESEEKFKSLFNSITDAILVADTDRNIMECNQAFTSVFGYTIEDIKNKPVRVLYENKKEFDEISRKIQGNCYSSPIYLRVNYRKKTGGVFPAEVGIFYLKNTDGQITGYIASIRDITEKQMAEKRLKTAFDETLRQNRKNKALLKGARAILSNNDFKKTAEVLFESCRVLLGASMGYVALLDEEQRNNELPFIYYNVEGSNVDPSLPMPLKGIRAEACNRGEAVFVNDFKKSQWINRLPEGHITLENVMIAPIVVQGKATGIIGLANKESGFNEEDAETLMAFADLAALAYHNNAVVNDLIEAKETAEKADMIKTAFISNMSHEIRTPMNAIIGFSDFLSDPGLAEEERSSYVETIQENGEVLMQIIDDILDISRIEAGELKVVIKQLELNELLKSIYESTLKGLHKKSGNNLDLNLVQELKNNKVLIKSDELRMKQVFTNLLSNALKFTKEGYVEMGYRMLQDNKVRLYVKDSGIGIAKEKQSEIFERFRQADDSNTRTYGGIGIGLTITKNLVELLGTRIMLNSEPGLGSEFYFDLPCEKVLEEEGNKKEENGNKSGFINLTGKTILIAEDVDSNFYYLQTLFKIFNAKIIRAENGQEALDLIRENADISMVLMDIQMPVLNGLDATRQIRAFNKDLPVLAQTAFATAEDEQLCMDAGCSDYISKPIKASQLINLIKKHIGL